MGDYALTYDAENRLTSVAKNGSTIATFVFDGDGKRVISTADGATTRFVSAGYEVKNPGASQEVSKYYFAGAQRIAFRTNGTLSYVTGDHLGSTSLTTDANGNLISELRYKPWGETRYVNGSTQTDYKYTGQREEASLGLYFYNARWYDPALGRFAQADTIVAKGVQGLDRYAYVNNSPIRYADPSGHDPSDCVSHDATETCQPPPPVLVILACGVDSTNDDCGADDQPLNGYDSWGTGHGYQVSRFGADTYGNEVGAVERYARAILAAMMAFLNENPTGKIYLIGHSRGGAAVAWALNLYLYEVGGDPSRIAKVVFIEPTVNTTDPKRKDDYAAYDTVLKNFDTHFYMSTSYDPAGPDGDLTTPDDDLNGLYSPLTVTIVQTSAICFIWCYPASPHMLMATEGNVTDLIMASFLTEPAHDYGRRR
jgi:RHS repeat-associated protein